MNVIKFDNVSIKIEDTWALKNIDFEVKKGENWAIIGDNGSGKTTLLNTILDNEYPNKGKILVADDIFIEKVASTFEGNRLVHQAYQYYQQRYNSDDAEITPSVFEVIQNQVKPLHTVEVASVQLPPKPFDDEAIEYYAKLLKINHLLDHKIVTLSNGETRRVHILNALLKQPDILLLDNPFVGLDVASRQILHDILENIMQEGISIILVCPIDEIPENIKNVLVLKAGKIEQILRGDLSYLDNIKKADFVPLDPQILAKIKKKPRKSNFKYAVRLRNVNIQYEGVKVVNNISWDIKKGDKWALLGPNGSGKSTLLSLITADNPQGYGNDYDLFDKKRGSGESIWDIKRRIGYVSPELQLYANEYNEVWTVVASGLFDAAELYQPLKPSQAKKVNTFLRLFGLFKLKYKLVHQLSSGQQKLVFLARALVKNPPLLILDEPCQGLDDTHMVQFRELINELVVSLDKTLIYVTHYTKEIPACVNQIFKIEEGRKVL